MTRLMNALSVVVVLTALAPSGGAPARAAAAEDETPTAAQTATPNVTAARPWVVRAEGAMLATHAGEIGPHVEVGPCVNREGTNHYLVSPADLSASAISVSER